MGMVHSSITPVKEWQFASTADTVDTTAVPVVAAVAGMRHRVMAVQVTNSHATVATVVQILTGSTVIANLMVGAVNGYAEAVFTMPLMGALATNIQFACVTTGAAVRVSVQGVTEISVG